MPDVILHGREEPESLRVMHENNGCWALIFKPDDPVLVAYRDKMMLDHYEADLNHDVG